jgi:hypothetical protein
MVFVSHQRNPRRNERAKKKKQRHDQPAVKYQAADVKGL